MCSRGKSRQVLKSVAGKRLLYRPLTGTSEVMRVGIARATNGDVTPAGEKFCDILRQVSSETGRGNSKPFSKLVLGGQKSPPRRKIIKR